MSADQPTRKLLVLDLDETLLHASEAPLADPEDFRVGPYHVYLRPGLDEFVAFALPTFRVGVWTASGERYASQVIDRVFPQGSLEFTWSSRRCTQARDWRTGQYNTLKNLAKLKRRGYALASIIAVDDTPSKYARSYGNLVTVREFVGDRQDDELGHLARYLAGLAKVPNVRTIEKRRWRERLDGTLPRPAAD